MNFQIENERVVAAFDSKGAEITSFKDKTTNIEYIWQADPAFWASHAPILFPFIGQSKNKQYEYNGKSYPMTNHGFAREYDFKVSEQSKDSISFVLTDSEATQTVYPFHFSFEITYKVEQASLAVSFQVKNTDTRNPLYYSLGAHPAFNVPLVEGTKFEDYSLSFSPKKKRKIFKLADLKDFLLDFSATAEAPTDEDLPLQYGLFKAGLFAYETAGATTCTLHSNKTSHSVAITYDTMPYVCVWSPTPKDAPFVCIEPWVGLPDNTKATGKLAEKFGIQKLEALTSSQTGFTITVK